MEVKGSFERNCSIQGYHNVYRAVWEVGVGEALMCEGDPESASNRYAVAMKKERTFIGHLLKVVMCVLLLAEGNIMYNKFL